MNTYFNAKCPECNKIHKVTYSEKEKLCDCGNLMMLFLNGEAIPEEIKKLTEGK